MNYCTEKSHSSVSEQENAICQEPLSEHGSNQFQQNLLQSPAEEPSLLMSLAPTLLAATTQAPAAPLTSTCAPLQIHGLQNDGNGIHTIEARACDLLRMSVRAEEPVRVAMHTPGGNIIGEGEGTEIDLKIVTRESGLHQLVSETGLSRAKENMSVTLTREPLSAQYELDESASGLQKEAANRWGIFVDEHGFQPVEVALLMRFGVDPDKLSPETARKLVAGIQRLQRIVRDKALPSNKECVELNITKSESDLESTAEYLLKTDEMTLRLKTDHSMGTTVGSLQYQHKDGTLVESRATDARGPVILNPIEGQLPKQAEPFASPQVGSDYVGEYMQNHDRFASGPNVYEQRLRQDNEDLQARQDQRDADRREGMGKAVKDGVVGFGKDMVTGGDFLTRATGLQGAEAQEEALAEGRRVISGVQHLTEDSSAVMTGVKDTIGILVEQSVELQTKIIDGAMEGGKQAIQHQVTQEFLAKTVAKKVTKQVVKKVAARVTQAVIKQLVTKVAISVGATESIIGAPIGVLQMAAMVQKIGSGQARLASQYPKISELLAPTGADMAWFLIEPQLPMIKAMIEDLVARELRKYQSRHAGQCAPGTEIQDEE
jgi:hypothetical protein